MVAGHLREQNGIYQIILNWKDINGKRKSKQISTGLPIKGNKKRAEQMLLKARTEFDPQSTINIGDMYFGTFLQKWLKGGNYGLDGRNSARRAYGRYSARERGNGSERRTLRNVYIGIRSRGKEEQDSRAAGACQLRSLGGV